MAIVKGTAGAQRVAAAAPPTFPDNYGEPLDLDPEVRMLLIGDTGAGKTTQIGEVAIYIAATEDKPTVLFTIDRGGLQPLKPQIKKGIIIPVTYDGVTDPTVWVSHALRGEAKEGGKWVNYIEKYGAGFAAEEGLTAFSEYILMSLSEHSAKNPGAAVGGDSAWIYEAVDGGEKIRIASNTMSHYGVVQLKIMQEIWKQNIGVASLWTAILDRQPDAIGGGGILGAKAVGKQLTPQAPRWFDYTMRINNVPAESGPARHVLYLEAHLDKQAKGAKVIANARLPLVGGEEAPVPEIYDPASLVNALLAIKKRNVAGMSGIDKRIEMIKAMRGGR